MIKYLAVTPRPLEIFDQIEALLNKEFRDKIFLPLMRSINQPATALKLNNSIEVDRDKLIRDIMSGKIYYVSGYFKGTFDAKTSKEMLRLKGVWSNKEMGWKVEREKIPYPIQSALLNSDVAFTQMVEKINKKFSEIIPAKFADSIPLENILSKLVYKVDEDVQATMKAVSIQPKISPELQGKLSDPHVGWRTNEVTKAAEQMRASIKGWTEENMSKLRGEIQESVLSGNRYGNIVKHIENTYSVSQSKAKFLARQETNLVVAKIKEARYQSAGITDYKWRCVVGSPNHPVRHYHKLNDGQTFSFATGAIVNKSGDRKNPGEDYNCRCTAVPIVRFDDEKSYS